MPCRVSAREVSAADLRGSREVTLGLIKHAALHAFFAGKKPAHRGARGGRGRGSGSGGRKGGGWHTAPQAKVTHGKTGREMNVTHSGRRPMFTYASQTHNPAAATSRKQSRAARIRQLGDDGEPIEESSIGTEGGRVEKGRVIRRARRNKVRNDELLTSPEFRQRKQKQARAAARAAAGTLSPNTRRITSDLNDALEGVDGESTGEHPLEHLLPGVKVTATPSSRRSSTMVKPSAMRQQRRSSEEINDSMLDFFSTLSSTVSKGPPSQMPPSPSPLTRGPSLAESLAAAAVAQSAAPAPAAGKLEDKADVAMAASSAAPPPAAPPLPSSAAPAAPPMAPPMVPGAPPMAPGAPGAPPTAAATANKMKRFHWDALPESSVAENTLWSELNQQPDEDALDEDDFLSAFAAKKPTAKLVPKKKEQQEQQLSTVKLLEAKRSYNIEIAISRIKLSHEEIRAAIVSMDENTLGDDEIATLAKFAPTSAEEQKLKAFKGDRNRLGTVEQFFLCLLSIPDVSAKLAHMHFLRTFDHRAEVVETQIGVVEEACKEIFSSDSLKQVLRVVLQLGNYLNGGTSKGKAAGFKLQSLRKLRDTKTTNNKSTLLHYLIQHIKKKCPEVSLCGLCYRLCLSQDSLCWTYVPALSRRASGRTIWPMWQTPHVWK